MAELPITLPTVREILTRVRADIASDMSDGGAAPTKAGAQDVYLPFTFAWAVSRALAGLAGEIYGFTARVLPELIPDSAVSWGVTRWATTLGVQRIPAQACEATATVTFLAAGTLSDGATVSRQSDGAEYTVDGAVSLGSAGTASATLVAVTAGEASSLEVGDILVIQSPPIQVFSLVTVTAVVQAGAEQETLEALKSRVLAKLADPPQGGAEPDYIAWAKAFDSTIERVWVRAGVPYLGGITVYFAIAGDDSAMVPSGGAATALQAELRRLAPVHSSDLVVVTAPTGTAIDVDVTLSPDNATVQGYVEDELRALLRNWYGDMDGTGSLLELDDVRDAIRRGVKRYSATGTFVLNTLDGASPADITLATGVLPYLGAVTF